MDRMNAHRCELAWLLVAVMLGGLGSALGTEPARAEEATANAVGTETGDDAKLTPMAADDPIPTKDLFSILREGGLMMIPIAVCSFILVMFVFERFISLRRGRIIPKPFVTRFLQQMRDGDLDRDQALALCEESGSPVAEVFAGAVRKWGRSSVEVEQAIIDAGERVTNTLRRYLRVLNASDALGRPELLATGISEALLTTAAGLTVAIPALIFYLFFVSRVDRLIIDIDALSQELVPLVSAEEMEERAKQTSTPKSRRSGRREAVA